MGASASSMQMTARRKMTKNSKAIDKMFREIDQNDDKMLDIQELHAYVDLHKDVVFSAMTVEELKLEISKFDFNGDGRLNRREFGACVEALQLHLLEGKAKAKADALKLHQAFRFFDKNKSGSLTEDEVMAILTNPIGGKACSKAEAMEVRRGCD